LHIRLYQMIRQSPLVGTSERLWSQPGFWPTSIPFREDDPFIELPVEF
jgi:hypothetical protein